MDLDRLAARMLGEKGGLKAVLVQRSGLLLLLKAVGAGLAFLSQIILARVLDSHVYGDYLYSLTWMTGIATLSRLGLDGVLLRFLPIYHADRDWYLFSKLRQKSQSWVLKMSILSSAIALIGIQIFGSQINPDLKNTLRSGCLVIPLLSLAGIQQTTIQSLGRVATSQIPDLIMRPLGLTALVMICGYVTQHPLTSFEVMMTTLVVTIVNYGAGKLYLHLFINKEDCRDRPLHQQENWFKAALPLLASTLFSLLLGQTDILLLGFFKGTEVAGVYITVIKVVSLLLFGISSINAIITPLISQTYATGNREELQHLVSTSSKIIVCFSAPVSLLLVIFGSTILSWFGPNFQSGYYALAILAIGQFFNSFIGSVGLLLSMTGFQVEFMSILFVSCILSLILSLILIPNFGLIGAAMSTSSIVIFWNILMWIQVRKSLNVNTIAFSSLF
jgi:O-antigen/teichoic acid export membrane protein